MTAHRQVTSSTDIAALVRGLRSGDRATLARAITLVESTRPDHQKTARQLVQELLPYTGEAIRVGITGAPGVGKSTSIDTLGSFLTAQGHKVAVLAVDPSSSRTGAEKPSSREGTGVRSMFSNTKVCSGCSSTSSRSGHSAVPSVAMRPATTGITNGCFSGWPGLGSLCCFSVSV